MLKLRLARFGRKKRAFYSIVLTENTSARESKFKKLGTYDPLTKQTTIDEERANYYLQRGAQPTTVIRRLFRGRLYNL